MSDYDLHRETLDKIEAVLAPLSAAKATPKTLDRAREMVSALFEVEGDRFHVVKVSYTAYGPLRGGPYIKLPDTCDASIDVDIKSNNMFEEGIRSYSVHRPAIRSDL